MFWTVIKLHCFGKYWIIGHFVKITNSSKITSKNNSNNIIECLLYIIIFLSTLLLLTHLMFKSQGVRHHCSSFTNEKTET